MSDSLVRVETVELDSQGSRQIRSRNRGTASLAERSGELEEAIVSASRIAQNSLTRLQEREGWRVSSLELTFGVTLAAEAGVILSKASAEASFEVVITVERA
ncbi:CU044_2847 family protein [Streptomyces sp. NPDC005538]|uniref:CU044_2847 family protein n=1 Tax=unclassified Streptomyces TaxID=2593676 RepID=UPI0033B171C1